MTCVAKRQKNDRSHAKRFWRPGVICYTFRLIYKSLMENYLMFVVTTTNTRKTESVILTPFEK